MSKRIPLTQGKFAVVDDDIFRLFAWVGWRNDGNYAVRNIAAPMRRFFPSKSRMFLHNLVLQPSAGFVADHINGDGLDCRRKNLRAVRPHQNAMNRGISSNNTSGFKGVTPFKQSGEFHKWRAAIRVNKKLIHLGLFDDRKEAARCYNMAARRLHGEFARLNRV